MTQSNRTVAFLLDYAPKNWCSREDYHVALCKRLEGRGIDSVLVFAKDVPSDLAVTFDELGIRYATIDYGKGVTHYYKSLGELIRKYKVTDVHICYFDYFSTIAWLARLHGIRHIVYEAVNSGSFGATSWKRALLKARTRLMTLPLRTVIAISEFVKQQLIAAGLTEGKIQVRHLGVDNSRFVPQPEVRGRFEQEFSIDSSEVILSTVSFLNPFKNPQTIIEACGLLSAEDVPFQLFVAGDGVLRGSLQKLARDLGIADRVHWLGHFSDPRSLLQASDIFALASVGEAFGFVLTEAMACGLPVVATQSGAIVEIVRDRETGFLVPPLDPRSFADALKRLIEDESLRRRMGEAGRRRVAELFTVDTVVQKTLPNYVRDAYEVS